MVLKVGSLFSGYGGLDLAVSNVFNTQPTWFIEYDKAPSKILNTHYPDVPNYGDVTQVNWEDLEPVDILTAGYPCQPFSTAGKRKGTQDDRHLWPHVHNAINTLQPKFAFFENVSGHLTLGFDTVLKDLASIGWNAEWTVNRASDIGAPHERKRLFILAYPNSVGLETKQLPVRTKQEVPWDNDMRETLAGLNSAPNLMWELNNRWGDSGPAVLAWMIASGRVPPPVIEDFIGKSIHPRFPEIREATNPEFIEWMMGLPDGWVTGCDISRAEQIKALGNGVVPQQGAAALCELLERIGVHI